MGPPSDVFSLWAVLDFAASGQGPFGADPPLRWSTAWSTARPTLTASRPKCGLWSSGAWPRSPASGPLPGSFWPSWPTRTLPRAGCLRRSQGSSRGRRESLISPARCPGRPPSPPGRLPGPGRACPTVTAARRDPAPSASPGQSRPAGLPGDALRRRRRPVMLALLLAGVLASPALPLNARVGRAGRHVRGDHAVRADADLGRVVGPPAHRLTRRRLGPPVPVAMAVKNDLRPVREMAFSERFPPSRKSMAPPLAAHYPRSPPGRSGVLRSRAALP